MAASLSLLLSLLILGTLSAQELASEHGMYQDLLDPSLVCVVCLMYFHMCAYYAMCYPDINLEFACSVSPPV